MKTQEAKNKFVTDYLQPKSSSRAMCQSGNKRYECPETIYDFIIQQLERHKDPATLEMLKKNYNFLTNNPTHPDTNKVKNFMIRAIIPQQVFETIQKEIISRWIVKEPSTLNINLDSEKFGMILLIKIIYIFQDNTSIEYPTDTNSNDNILFNNLFGIIMDFFGNYENQNPKSITVSDIKQFGTTKGGKRVYKKKKSRSQRKTRNGKRRKLNNHNKRKTIRKKKSIRKHR